MIAVEPLHIDTQTNAESSALPMVCRPITMADPKVG
jgi:hypothetical protein